MSRDIKFRVIGAKMTTVFYVQGFDVIAETSYIVGNKFYINRADAEAVKKDCVSGCIISNIDVFYTVQSLEKG